MASAQDARIVEVEWASLRGVRPRAAGSNARLGPHGAEITVPLVRLQTADGTTGFGFGRPDPDLAAALLGRPLGELYVAGQGVALAWRQVEYALWDLAARRNAVPVYALAAAQNGRHVSAPYQVPCYDTSLYFDDLQCASDQEGAALIAEEAREGFARGHAAFKIKVGRGARHIESEEGLRRDVAVVRAVRAAVGPACALMLDANNGYTLTLARRALAETSDCAVYWLEEPFHEDSVLDAELHSWLARRALPVLLADGEGEASPSLLEWARQGLIDVVQYDIIGHGFTQWLATGRLLDDWGVRSAPHHYGTCYGNYAACHLAAAIEGFAYVEWDETHVPGLDASGYVVRDGRVSVPAVPGFGLHLDDAYFRRAVDDNGYRLSAG